MVKFKQPQTTIDRAKLDFSFVKAKMKCAIEVTAPNDLRHGTTRTARARDMVITITNCTSAALKKEGFQIRVFVDVRTGRAPYGIIEGLIIIDDERDMMVCLPLIVTASYARLDRTTFIALERDDSGIAYLDELFRAIETVVNGPAK
jgi:hypothetical protein